MKRALITLFAVASTLVACAEREKEAPQQPPPPAAQTTAAVTPPKPQHLTIKRPLNLMKIENTAAANLPAPSVSAPASAAPSAK